MSHTETRILLERMKYDDGCTLGQLTVGDLKCFTLELPWLGNQRNVSCIPTGTYKWFKRISPSRNREVIELIDVPDRAYIQIHPGNYTRQIQGCILPGMGLRDLDKDGVTDVSNSVTAVTRLMDLTAETGTIDIVDCSC